MVTELKAASDATPRTVAEPDPAKFYVNKGGESYGPETETTLRPLYEDGWLSPDDLIWWEGQPEWLPVGKVFGSSLIEGRAAPLDATPTHPDEGSDGDDLSIYASTETRWPWGSFSIAIFVHAVLAVVVLLWLQLYPIKFTAYTTVTPSQDPPLEVTMQPEQPTAPPPPPPDPTPPDPTPPEPPPPMVDDELPPPPAPPEMAIPVPPPPPPAPVVSDVPPQTTPAPTPVAVVPRHHDAPKVTHRIAPLPAPSEAQPAASNDEPQYLTNPRPAYPFAARQRHQQGTVLLRVVLDAAGNPVSVSVEQSSGYTILDDAALKKVAADWKFKPGQGSTVRVPVEFQLEQ